MNLKALTTLILLLAFSGSIRANPCEGITQGFVNDFSDCSRYFSCLNGVARPITCPDNRWFALEPLGCHPANSIDCDRCPAAGIISFPVAGSCTLYTMCINGNALDRECLGETRFDPIQGRCNLLELVPCAAGCPATGNTLVADPTSCSHYLVCVEGVEVARRECAPLLLFDPALPGCARQELVTCALRAFSFYAAPIPTVPNVFPTVPTAQPRSS